MEALLVGASRVIEVTAADVAAACSRSFRSATPISGYVENGSAAQWYVILRAGIDRDGR